MPTPIPIQPVSPPPEVRHTMTVDHVYDGDTIVGKVVLWDTASDALTSITVYQSAVYDGRVRLLSSNAPEMKDVPRGAAVRDFVRSVIKPGDVIETRAPRDLTDQYGRMVADLWYVPFDPDKRTPAEPVNLSAVLLAADMAAPMTGKKLQRLAPQLPDQEAEAFVAHVPALLTSKD
jgi:endonuclease YncB( thermonuclease family)